ncbi:MAG TPA: hypothetical protein VFW31_07605 [Candidatus Angelobacter sp.]|nr:hypothetical protein [Candidatus Angelobacter sp.]
MGYLRHEDRRYSKTITRYRSLAVFGPRDTKLPRFHLFDVEAPKVDVPTVAKDTIAWRCRT